MATREPVLFCPFCRESFEGRTTCPAHDLELVRWDELPPDPEAEGLDSSRDLAFYDPRHGRGVVVFGAALALVGFALPVVHTSLSERLEVTGVLLASTRAGNLWTVPLVGCAVIALVLRPGTTEALRRVRLAVASGGLVGLASLGFTSFRMLEAARLVGERTGQALVVEPRAGAFVMLVGLLLVLVGSMRLGVD